MAGRLLRFIINLFTRKGKRMDTDKAFEQALAEVLGIEGGYSDIKEDRGGKTNYGITEAVARGEPYNYTGDMRELPFELAKQIYYEGYWEASRLKLDKISRFAPAGLPGEIFEQAVNTGVYRTAKRVQRVLNMLNRDESLYPDLKVDGWLGAKAREAFKFLMEADDYDNILRWLNVAQGAYYMELLENDPTQEAFARGWISKRVIVKGG